jgi:hypothetical protein
MTKEQLVAALRRLSQGLVDEEIAHGNADRLLLEYINEAEVTEAWENIPKWFA